LKKKERSDLPALGKTTSGRGERRRKKDVNLRAVIVEENVSSNCNKNSYQASKVRREKMMKDAH
jgi:hypothetical protein